MPITWSRIHANLGLTPTALTYEHIAAAVADGMREAEDLDWKGALPGKTDGQPGEFAKDAAAMANTIGGLIVYGVTEDGATSAAKDIVGVDTAETQQRRLRALAASRIHPLVSGLQIAPLANEDGSKRVLALWVPSSPDAPHIVGERAAMGVPYRSGAETQWMRERELERAYADRFDRRVSENERLASLIDEATDHVDLERGAWIVGAATPRRLRQSQLVAPSRDDAVATLKASLQRASELVPGSAAHRDLLIRELGDAALNPNVGCRGGLHRRGERGSRTSKHPRSTWSSTTTARRASLLSWKGGDRRLSRASTR